MMEYWAALGLACIDSNFRKEIHSRSRSEDLKELHDTLMEKYHFRLSRLEVGEIRRIFRQDGAMENFERLQMSHWGHACCTGMTYDPKYVHHDRKPGEECF